MRVHEDSVAQIAAANVGALAFAHGPDIYLSTAAQTKRDALISHELGHVVASAGRPPKIERFPNQAQAGSAADLVNIVLQIEATQPEGINAGQTLEKLVTYVSRFHGGLTGFRYFETRKYGWIDIKHFCTAANLAVTWGATVVNVLGFGNEIVQWLTEWGTDYRSGFSAEDIPSNSAGSNFGAVLQDSPALSEQLSAYLNDELGAIDLSSSTSLSTLPATDQGGATGPGQSGSTSDNPTQPVSPSRSID